MANHSCNRDKPQALPCLPTCPLHSLLFRIRPSNTQLIPLLDLVFLFKGPLHLLQPSELPWISRPRVHNEERARRQRSPHAADMGDGARDCCRELGRRGLGRRRIFHSDDVVAMVVRPSPACFQLAHACPGEVDASVGDHRAIGVTKHGSLDAIHDVSIRVAADAEGSHLAEILLRGTVIDDRSGLALAGISRQTASGSRRPRESLEDCLPVCCAVAPFWALFALHLDEIEARSAVFDAVVAQAPVPFLDLAVEILLREPLEGGFQRGTSWVLVEDRGIDDEGMGELQCCKIRI